MKPFNLAEAIAGKPIMTKGLVPVRYLMNCPEAQPDYRIIVLFPETGWVGGINPSALCMAPETKDLFLNIYPSCSTATRVIVMPHSSEEEADARNNLWGNVQRISGKAIKLTIEV